MPVAQWVSFTRVWRSWLRLPCVPIIVPRTNCCRCWARGAMNVIHACLTQLASTFVRSHYCSKNRLLQILGAWRNECHSRVSGATSFGFRALHYCSKNRLLQMIPLLLSPITSLLHVTWYYTKNLLLTAADIDALIILCAKNLTGANPRKVITSFPRHSNCNFGTTEIFASQSWFFLVILVLPWKSIIRATRSLSIAKLLISVSVSF